MLAVLLLNVDEPELELLLGMQRLVIGQPGVVELDSLVHRLATHGPGELSAVETVALHASHETRAVDGLHTLVEQARTEHEAVTVRTLELGAGTCLHELSIAHEAQAPLELESSLLRIVTLEPGECLCRHLCIRGTPVGAPKRLAGIGGETQQVPDLPGHILPICHRKSPTCSSDGSTVVYALLTYESNICAQSKNPLFAGFSCFFR